MDAEKLKKKKVGINKGKLKKTLKTVVCRPDPVFWPIVTDDEESLIKTSLEKYRVHIPEYKKPHWMDLKAIPKNKRPKRPPIEKVEGLIFGMSECCYAVKSNNCTAVLIEANVNPQAIVQQIVDTCTTNSISVLCLKDLKQISKKYFGIPAICLGFKRGYLQELSNKLLEIYQNYKPKPKNVSSEKSEDTVLDNLNKKELPMDVDNNPSYCPYVYRTDKKTRAFIPSFVKEKSPPNKFSGQNFIKLPQEKTKSDSKAYMKMILKKISNNPNRDKFKQK